MKKKIGFICVMCILIGMVSYGCRSQNVEDNTGNDSQTIEDHTENSGTSEQEEAELIDEEYLLEHCGVTKEELEGIDVEEFINRYQLTAEYLEERDIHGLITWYRKMLEQEAEPTYDDYADIFTGAEKGGYQDAYEDQICIMAITEMVDPDSVVFDLEQGVYYYAKAGEGYVIEDYSSASKSGELSEEDIATIRTYIREAGIGEWQATTGEHEPGTLWTGNDWNLVVVCSDGKKYLYGGCDYPDGLYDMYIKLMRLIEVPTYEDALDG